MSTPRRYAPAGRYHRSEQLATLRWNEWLLCVEYANVHIGCPVRSQRGDPAAAQQLTENVMFAGGADNPSVLSD